MLCLIVSEFYIAAPQHGVFKSTKGNFKADLHLELVKAKRYSDGSRFDFGMRKGKSLSTNNYSSIPNTMNKCLHAQQISDRKDEMRRWRGAGSLRTNGALYMKPRLIISYRRQQKAQ